MEFSRPAAPRSEATRTTVGWNDLLGIFLEVLRELGDQCVQLR